MPKNSLKVNIILGDWGKDSRKTCIFKELLIESCPNIILFLLGHYLEAVYP